MCDCFSHFVRIGRANYHCVECMRDVSIELVLLAEIGENVVPTHDTFIFDDYEKEKQYGIGDKLHIGDNYYKVMEIDGTRIICAKLIPEHK